MTDTTTTIQLSPRYVVIHCAQGFNVFDSHPGPDGTIRVEPCFATWFARRLDAEAWAKRHNQVWKSLGLPVLASFVE